MYTGLLLLLLLLRAIRRGIVQNENGIVTISKHIRSYISIFLLLLLLETKIEKCFSFVYFARHMRDICDQTPTFPMRKSQVNTNKPTIKWGILHFEIYSSIEFNRNANAMQTHRNTFFLFSRNLVPSQYILHHQDMCTFCAVHFFFLLLLLWIYYVTFSMGNDDNNNKIRSRIFLPMLVFLTNTVSFRNIKFLVSPADIYRLEVTSSPWFFSIGRFIFFSSLLFIRH